MKKKAKPKPRAGRVSVIHDKVTHTAFDFGKLADDLGLPMHSYRQMADDGEPVLPKVVVVKHGSLRPPPFEARPPDDPAKKPKKWKEGDLKRGMIVFYMGLRYWVERVDWDYWVVWISDSKIHPDVTRMAGDKRESFCVHPDLLSEAPQVTKLGAALPTVASAARAERAKAGVRDVGDEVAVLLRACADLEAVYKAASKYLGVPVSDLKQKYGHLNHGQQRMNCGNKMRWQWKVNNGLVRAKK